MPPKAHKKDKDKEGAAENEGDPDAFVFSTDAVIGDIQRKAAAVFEVFDQGGTKMVDVREVGTMLRALGETLFIHLYPIFAISTLKNLQCF